MDIMRFRTNQSDFVLEPTDSIPDWFDEKARGRAKTEADAVRKSRLAPYREMAAQGLPLEGLKPDD